MWLKKLESIVIPSCYGQRFGVAVSLDIKNAFNSACWERILQSLTNQNLPPYLVRMIRTYFNDRMIEIEMPSDRIEKEITSRVPKRSVLGLLLWNLMFDGVLRALTPPGTKTICFANDMLILAEGSDG